MPTDFDELLKIQRRMLSMLSKETETDLKIDILTIIERLTTGKNKRIQKEAVILEAEQQGISGEDVLNIIEELKRDGLIIEPEIGFIMLK